MLRYKLRTLLILLAIGPPMLAWWAWPAWLAYCKYQHREAMSRLMLITPRIIISPEEKEKLTIEITP
jgi:hypothetical protein